MSVSAKELHWNGGEMGSNGRQNGIVLSACDIAEGSVANDNDKIDVTCLVAQNGSEPLFFDESFDGLTCRHELVVAWLSMSLGKAYL